MECTPRKCFSCGSEDHIIAKCPKQVCYIENFNYTCNNGENNSNCEIYTSIAQMSSKNEWKNCGETENWDRTLVQKWL